MRALRRIIPAGVLAALGLLAALAVVGALLGASRAGALFNSVPLAVFWAVLGVLLAAGFVGYRSLLHSPGLAAMHAGCLLVLGGAMWGSEAAHALRARWLGSERVASGFMPIFKRQATDRILARDMQTVLGRTPFLVALEDFWIEYYPPSDPTWSLAAVSASADDGSRREAPLEWAAGQEFLVPFTPVRMTVLQYLPRARPTFADGARPEVRITGADGRETVLAAEVGREATVAEPAATVRVVEVLANLRMRGRGDEREVYDAGGAAENPAVRLEVRRDGRSDERFLMAYLPMHGPRDEGLRMRYVLPEPTGAEPDPASETPAMQVGLRAGDREARRWLLPRPGETFTWLPLAPVYAGESPDGGADEGPGLVLVQPKGPIREYKSTLVILEDEREVARKTIEVNDPLHWGGYHFYQADYDHEAERYSVLSVASDAGLSAAYVGFFLVVMGAAARLWAEPLWRRRKARRA